MYPCIVLIIMVGIGILMMMYVMPSITGTFKSLGTELPATTQALMTASEFINEHTIVTFALMFGVVFGFISFLKTAVGKRIFSWIVVRLPIIGKIAKESNAAVLARTLSSLLSSGVDMLRALEITEDVIQNFQYKALLEKMPARHKPPRDPGLAA